MAPTATPPRALRGEWTAFDGDVEGRNKTE